MEDIEHSKIKANHPQIYGICERFQRTIKQECSGIAFRKKIYVSIEELQIDVDRWIANYNESRPHNGKFCYGKTSMQPFRETRHLAKEMTIPAAEPEDTENHLTRAA